MLFIIEYFRYLNKIKLILKSTTNLFLRPYSLCKLTQLNMHSFISCYLGCALSLSVGEMTLYGLSTSMPLNMFHVGI